MREAIRVLVLGTGRMGSGIARLVLDKEGLELVGAFGRRPERSGTDLGSAIGHDELGLPIEAHLSKAIACGKPDIAIQTTCSRASDAAEEIATLVRRGVHVISIAEEMAYPACRSPEVAKKIRRLALANEVAVLGTGINPGFVLDLLVITLTGVCTEVESIRAKRVNDLSPYGPSVLASQGVGLSPEAFRRGLEDGTVLGHVGFQESIEMIAAALGWHIERVEESREPIIAQVKRTTPFATIKPGQVAGCLHNAVGYRDGTAAINLIHPQQVQPHLEGVETGDSIEIRGTPSVRLSGSPEIPGGVGTIALAVNMIPRVLNAAPGLYSMAELPVPAALLGDARAMVRAAQREPGHG